MIRIKLQRSHAAELALFCEKIAQVAAEQIKFADKNEFLIICLLNAELLEQLTKLIEKPQKKVTIKFSYPAALAFESTAKYCNIAHWPLLQVIIPGIIAEIDKHKFIIVSNIFGIGQPD